ncbi:hypothetical protein GOC91_26770 [Sinorhizobium medicae]|uniref:Guanylate cyclase domain-containing protein n=1 Tax=Sinorhizobium medicae TaxID=110321 RepID=A0A6G1WG33_9HYPH|nr:hypothetical protein [Sinorhizobium medicae]MDX0413750.1 hypothetical protein [Sinorhizobium medicae]MDX0426134.1 hypothetical protein [Sinorhizobium medicae]MDX0431665.1 hypothetical protein [Sinorhizobium medicae]MDX0436536.1 hypothetical protein [Sinorhizobium medicae]
MVEPRKNRGWSGAHRNRIGLHSGEVVVGNTGHARRLEYTIIGDTVNVVGWRGLLGEPRLT